MASHVSTCMPMEKSIKWEGNQFVEEERNKKERKGKKSEERERERGGKRKLAFRRSELAGLRSKVCIFDDGYTPRGKDSS